MQWANVLLPQNNFFLKQYKKEGQEGESCCFARLDIRRTVQNTKHISDRGSILYDAWEKTASIMFYGNCCQQVHVCVLPSSFKSILLCVPTCLFW